MEPATESTETIDCIFIEKKIVSSNTELDPLIYFFEITPSKEKIEWKETKLLSYFGLKKGLKYRVSYLVWTTSKIKFKRWIVRIESENFAFYIKNKNSIIKENLKTGEKINLSKPLY